ncbi:hypothetical protein PAXRUDRAFT_824463 [Paxillus rubicundulus Ve08.2h10]|uniref:Uncharacterized protein n=1 Tax=Paxillus rubicundulus Ve08.2h10 TaxID=930991 RepID=A0A0D0DUD6_9AGAM|nr:hypothetical protein PAXRUDRAFT_824463 [Paxillus rubicundulus Ve08.2h10]
MSGDDYTMVATAQTADTFINGAIPLAASATPPQGTILKREADALKGCFKNAIVKTGQTYAFHADSRRLGIHKYAPYPPRTLITSLGRELEKYDQLCDAIESQLSRAISILKRDLAREERRAREAEQAAISAQAAKSPMLNRIPLPPIEANDATMLPPSATRQGSPPGPMANMPGRRQSAISLSSLNRNPFPLKLDLSSSSMRISAEEAAMFPKGLVPSPVSLAPKSARPSATADIDLMAAFASAAAVNSVGPSVDIDLTVSDSPSMMTGVDHALGNSADKPIELDLDGIDIEMSNMTDLFGDAAESSSGDGQTAVDSLFSPDTSAPLSASEASHPSKMVKSEGHIDMKILDALNGEGGDQAGNLFGPVANRSNGCQQPLSGSNAAPSPRSLIASFAHVGPLDSSSEHMQGGDTGFDLSTLDLSNLDPAFFSEHDMNMTDMVAFLNMHPTGGSLEAQKPGL